MDAHAREKLPQWTKESIENMFVYRIDGGNVEKAYCGYEPTWLPEGFVLVDRKHRMKLAATITTMKMQKQVRFLLSTSAL